MKKEWIDKDGRQHTVEITATKEKTTIKEKLGCLTIAVLTSLIWYLLFK